VANSALSAVGPGASVVPSAKWSRNSSPHCKEYEEAYIELAQRFRHLDSNVDKRLTDLNLAHVKSVDQLQEWLWYGMLWIAVAAQSLHGRNARCTKVRQ
jgi:hypothetical protein